MTQVNRLATVVVPLHFLSCNRWLSWSGADGVTIAKVELTPESYTVDCALPVPVTKIYHHSHQTDRVCPVPQLPQSVPQLPQTLTPQTVSVLCHSYHSHRTDRVHPVQQLPQSLTGQTVSILCNSYHSHSHNRPCPSCATATTVTHTTDRVHPVQQLPQSLTPHSHTTDHVPPSPWSKQ